MVILRLLGIETPCGCTDRNAFIFSLRRNGETKNDKFKIKHSGSNAFHHGDISSHLEYTEDILIKDSSNINFGSYCCVGKNYEFTSSTPFLAGYSCLWLTAEIEVYEIQLA